jgi:AraC-like DNA-binding protein
MDPFSFSTKDLSLRDQQAAWSEWFRPVFDVEPEDTELPGFDAEYSVWRVGDVSVTWASAPAARTVRTSSHLRQSPIDHWVITYCPAGATTISTKQGQLDARAGVPFVWSLGQPSDSRREAAERMQLYLPRDSFSGISAALDMATGSVLSSPAGRLLADYMVLLKRNLADLTPENAARLPDAIEAMVALCLAPSADQAARASQQIDLTLMERVRRAVRKNLHSPSLGPDKLCREAAMSRSKLYRVLESEGGVAQYIQRHRLMESFRMLCDVSSNQAIGRVAEILCFADASSFSRAFRRAFGTSPGDVRAAALAGLIPVASPRRVTEGEARSFGDCLRS